jgi:metallo-beta-lactamase family protein
MNQCRGNIIKTMSNNSKLDKNPHGKLSIFFCGGVDSVTGANFILQGPDSNGVMRKIGFDCGMEQGTPESHDFNRSEFPYDPKSLEVLFITHAHMDHIGRIPKLVRDGFNGVIYSTPETYELAIYMLADALKITTHDSAKKNEPPLFEEADVKKSFSLWKQIKYHTEHEIFPGFTAYGRDAGHVLGSTMWEINYTANADRAMHRRIVFTGDLGNSPSPLLRDTEDIINADYIVMESVYGDRNHESREERVDRLREVILDVERRKGTLLIPAFSLEKTQELLYILNGFFEKGNVPTLPVYVDSPLAVNLTTVYQKMARDFNSEAAQLANKDDIFSFPRMKIIQDANESRELKFAPNPKVIIAGSGMSTGGRIQHHETNHLPDPNTTILLLGYQAVGTLGREIQGGARQVMIYNEPVDVRAKVVTINGFSSHKDSEHLVEFVSKTAETLRNAFVVMGETKTALFLVQRLRDYLGVSATHPNLGDVVELE